MFNNTWNLLYQHWSPRTKADSDVLEGVQKRAVSMVSGLKSTEYLERLEELKMPTLQQQREEIDMTEMYKIMTGKSAVEPNIWFERVNRNGVLTRQADPLNVKISAARLELRKNFFSAHVCEKWNNLPSEIKNSVNARSFKAIYRKHTGSNPSQAADETGQDARE
jgi:hypothetical protein